MSGDDILVLGGNGFIGSALVRRLQNEARHVHVISPHVPPVLSPGVTFHQGSMHDESILKAVLPACRTIVHAASGTNPGSSARRASQESRLNISPSLSLVEALDRQAEFHLIFVSSGGTVYGNPAALPASEKAALHPLSYYAAGKIALEAFFRVAAKPPMKTLSILRPSNVYGPGQTYRPDFGVIRTMLECLHRGHVMEIWGDGETIRDYLYIDDMVEAIFRMVGQPTDNATYNVGSGVGLSLNQIVRIIERVCGIHLNVRYRAQRRSDVSGIVLDSSLFSHRTGWRGTVSFEEGIAKTWRWLMDQENHT
jgi:UDP-glucose 4-epimerase